MLAILAFILQKIIQYNNTDLTNQMSVKHT